MKRYLFASQFARGKRVLDLGCGYGYRAAFLADNIVQSVKGIDSDEKCIRFAKRRYALPNLSFELADLELAVPTNEAYDVIVSFEVMEHLRSIDNYLGYVNASLKGNGHFFLSTPNKRYTEQTYTSDRPLNPSHAKEYYPKEMYEILGASFRVVDVFAQYEKHGYDMTVVRQSNAIEATHMPRWMRKLFPDFVRNVYLKTKGVDSPVVGWALSRLHNCEDDIIVATGRNQARPTVSPDEGEMTILEDSPPSRMPKSCTYSSRISQNRRRAHVFCDCEPLAVRSPVSPPRSSGE